MAACPFHIQGISIESLNQESLPGSQFAGKPPVPATKMNNQTAFNTG
jgi:hypothetical protein